MLILHHILYLLNLILCSFLYHIVPMQKLFIKFLHILFYMFLKDFKLCILLRQILMIYIINWYSFTISFFISSPETTFQNIFWFKITSSLQYFHVISYKHLIKIFLQQYILHFLYLYIMPNNIDTHHLYIRKNWNIFIIN